MGGDIWHWLVYSNCPETLRRLDTYGGGHMALTGWIHLSWHTEEARHLWEGTNGIDSLLPIVSPDFCDVLNITEMKASHWSRASNACLWLVQRVSWEWSKGYPLYNMEGHLALPGPYHLSKAIWRGFKPIIAKCPFSQLHLSPVNAICLESMPFVPNQCQMSSPGNAICLQSMPFVPN